MFCTPLFRVTAELGQPVQEPCIFSFTIPFSKPYKINKMCSLNTDAPFRVTAELGQRVQEPCIFSFTIQLSNPCKVNKMCSLYTDAPFRVTAEPGTAGTATLHLKFHKSILKPLQSYNKICLQNTDAPTATKHVLDATLQGHNGAWTACTGTLYLQLHNPCKVSVMSKGSINEVCMQNMKFLSLNLMIQKLC